MVAFLFLSLDSWTPASCLREIQFHILDADSKSSGEFCPGL